MKFLKCICCYSHGNCKNTKLVINLKVIIFSYLCFFDCCIPFKKDLHKILDFLQQIIFRKELIHWHLSCSTRLRMLYQHIPSWNSFKNTSLYSVDCRPYLQSSTDTGNRLFVMPAILILQTRLISSQVGHYKFGNFRKNFIFPNSV